MTPTQFGEILSRSGYDNLQKIALRNGDGYYAEQFSHADQDRDEPHWKVVYAIGREEKMQMAQYRFDAIGVSSYARLQQSREDAQKLLDDNQQVFNIGSTV